MSECGEFIKLSTYGVFGVFLVGFFIGDAVQHATSSHDAITDWLLATVTLIWVRVDAKSTMKGGRYTRRFLIWKRDEVVSENVGEEK